MQNKVMIYALFLSKLILNLRRVMMPKFGESVKDNSMVSYTTCHMDILFESKFLKVCKGR